MKNETVVVRSKLKSASGVKEVVGEIVVTIYETLAEAVDGLSEAKCLELINSQNKTNEANKARALATGKPSKGYLREQALSEITVEEFAQCAQDPARISALIESKMAAIEARMASAPKDEGDDE